MLPVDVVIRERIAAAHALLEGGPAWSSGTFSSIETFDTVRRPPRSRASRRISTGSSGSNFEASGFRAGRRSRVAAQRFRYTSHPPPVSSQAPAAMAMPPVMNAPRNVVGMGIGLMKSMMLSTPKPTRM
ncbi:MAG TPA: hypothetical protein VLH81_12590 [Desulfobacterales bacterium]|nr:hypothetical protein [Desulfobacterales bacterium]